MPSALLYLDWCLYLNLCTLIALPTDGMEAMNMCKKVEPGHDTIFLMT